MIDSGRIVHIGSYTVAPAGRGAGVTTATLDPATGTLTMLDELALPSPSYLLGHPLAPVVYAVDESADAVSVLRRGDDGLLALVDRHPTGGAGPCHLAMTPDARFLLTAEYGGGSISVFGLEPDGSVTGRTDAVSHDAAGGLGPDPARQEAPHVHMVVPEPDGLVHVVDLGTDEIRTYVLGDDGRLEHRTTSRVAPGTGPRQLLRLPEPGPDGAARYVLVGELADTLLLLEAESGGGFRTVSTRAATGAPAPEGVRNAPAHLELGPAGTVHLSNRGADRISTFAVDGDLLVPVGEVSTGGAWPRHFALVGDHVLVCDEFDDRVVVLAADPATGALRTTGQHLDVGTPACVVAAG